MARLYIDQPHYLMPINHSWCAKFSTAANRAAGGLLGDGIATIAQHNPRIAMTLKSGLVRSMHYLWIIYSGNFR